MEVITGIAAVVVGVAVFLGVVGKISRDSKRITEIEKKLKDK
jgi:hypothetical protein